MRAQANRSDGTDKKGYKGLRTKITTDLRVK